MKKLYNRFFFVPEEGKGKVSEKVLIARIAATVLVVVVCLVQMSLGAIAHFLGNVEIKTRHIVTAAYDLDCTISSGGQSTIAKKITATDADIYPRTYEITLTLDGNNTASTGFCLITVDYLSAVQTAEEGVTETPDHIYYTSQIGEDESAQGGERNSITFTLELSAPATVRLVPNWGVSAYYGYDIENDDLFVEHGDIIAPPPPPVEENTNGQPEANIPNTEPDAFESTVPENSDTPDESSESDPADSVASDSDSE